MDVVYLYALQISVVSISTMWFSFNSDLLHQMTLLLVIYLLTHPIPHSLISNPDSASCRHAHLCI